MGSPSGGVGRSEFSSLISVSLISETAVSDTILLSDLEISSNISLLSYAETALSTELSATDFSVSEVLPHEAAVADMTRAAKIMAKTFFVFIGFTSLSIDI